MGKATSIRLILASGSPARRDLLQRAGYQFDVQPAHIDEPTGEGFSDPRTYVQTVAWLKASAVAQQLSISEPLSHGTPGERGWGEGVEPQSMGLDPAAYPPHPRPLSPGETAEKVPRASHFGHFRGQETGYDVEITGESSSFLPPTGLFQLSPGVPGERGELILAADTVGWLDGQVIGKPADEADARRILTFLGGRQHELWTGVVLWQRPGDMQITWQERSLVFFRKLNSAELDTYIAGNTWQGCSGGYAIQEQNDPYVKIVEGSMSNVIGLPMESLTEVLAGVAKISGMSPRPGGAAECSQG